MGPSPSPGSTVSSSNVDDGRHQALLSPPFGTPAPEPEDGGSNSLTRAVLSLSLSEPGITTVKAGSSAPRAAAYSSSPPGSAVSSDHQGTERRVVLVSGTFSQVMDAMELLLEKLLNQGDQAIHSQYTTFVLVVPQACCGQLIGKGGLVIRSLNEVSGAEVQVSPQDTCYGSNDRLVSITGPLENQLQALFQILFILLENGNYTFTYTSAMGGDQHWDVKGDPSSRGDDHATCLSRRWQERQVHMGEGGRKKR